MRGVSELCRDGGKEYFTYREHRNARTLDEISWAQSKKGKEVSCENAQARGRGSGSKVRGSMSPGKVVP